MQASVKKARGGPAPFFFSTLFRTAGAKCGTLPHATMMDLCHFERLDEQQFKSHTHTEMYTHRDTHTYTLFYTPVKAGTAVGNIKETK